MAISKRQPVLDATPMEQLAFKAVDVRAEIARLENRACLSAESFVSGACELAEINRKRLAEVRHALQRHSELSVVRQCRRGLSHMIRDGHLSHVPSADKMMKVMRLATKTEGLTEELSVINVRPAEAFAAIIADLADVEPERFGAVKSWAAHEAELKRLREELESLYWHMDEALGTDDLLTLSRTHHKDGSTSSVTTLRRGQGIYPLGNSQWMSQFCDLIERLPNTGGSTKSSGPTFAAKRRAAALAAHEQQSEIDRLRAAGHLVVTK